MRVAKTAGHGPSATLACCALLAIASGCVRGSTAPSPPPEPRRLQALLYPYVPDRPGLFASLERSFERANPDIDLVLLDASGAYYASERPGSLLRAVAEVYEVDSVLLDDLLEQGVLQPLPAALVPAEPPFPWVEAAVRRGGRWYARPHWLCSRLLFFDAEDEPMRQVRTLKELERAAAPPAGAIVDLTGISTLGELFLDWWSERELSGALPLESAAPAARQLAAAEVDLRRLLALCPSGACRRRDLHEAPGSHARLFARREARAFAGYAEALRELEAEAAACPVGTRCRTARELDVAALPVSDSGGRPLGFVDGLAIASRCTDRCLADAGRLIAYLVSQRFYLEALVPPEGPPRYLLPAESELYRNPQLLAAAPLYARLGEIMREARAVTAPGLNARLRAAGAALDERLGR